MGGGNFNIYFQNPNICPCFWFLFFVLLGLFGYFYICSCGVFVRIVM